MEPSGGEYVGECHILNVMSFNSQRLSDQTIWDVQEGTSNPSVAKFI